jgi:hypothetical protein
MVVSRTNDRIDSLVRRRRFLCIGNMKILFSFLNVFLYAAPPELFIAMEFVIYKYIASPKLAH